MADHNEFGKIAEELACRFLEDKGYRILCKNYRYLKAEIDIICEFSGEIIFVEVKARATDAFMEPHEAVKKKKIKLMISGANEFLKDRNEEARFDIISVLKDEKGKLNITHIENAFTIIDG